MNRKFTLFFLVVALFFLLQACNETQESGKSESAKLSIGESNNKTVYTVTDFFNVADSLSKDTLLVEGVIDHLCRHKDNRFTIISLDGESSLKVETIENIKRPEPSDIGKKVIVKGRPLPTQLNLEALEKWEQSIRNNHVGEEDTEDFKNDVKAVQEAKEKVSSGQIPYYTIYSLEAFGYEFVGE